MATETGTPTSTAATAFPWHELLVPDAKAGIEFYQRALDFGTENYDTSAMGMTEPYRMLTKNGVPVAGSMDLSASGMPNTPPQWAVFLAVDDVDGRIEKCVGLGATLVVPALDVPMVGRMAMTRDPQGAHLWLFKPETR